MSKVNSINLDAKYEGYIWMSNESKPYILRNQPVYERWFSSVNPFIVEGQLYDQTNKTSYNIRNIDGELIIFCYLVDEKDENVTRIDYLANRMENVSKLKFLQYWRPKDEDHCKTMKVLSPCELVFIGFINNKEY